MMHGGYPVMHSEVPTAISCTAERLSHCASLGAIIQMHILESSNVLVDVTDSCGGGRACCSVMGAFLHSAPSSFLHLFCSIFD